MSDSPAAILYDSDGTKIETVTVGDDRYIGAAVVQDVHVSTNNSSTDNLAGGDSFTGISELTLGSASIQINIFSDQPIRINVQQSSDGYNWDISDIYITTASLGDARTIQAAAAYFRIIATNLSPNSTTQFRLNTFMCPIIEVLPRSLSQDGALKLTKQTKETLPSPYNFIDRTILPSLSADSLGLLLTRGQVLTDERSYRTDFTNADIYTTLSGTCFFRNGSNYVIGDSTNFLDEVKIGDYIKLSSDPDSNFGIVSDINSDIALILEDVYSGSTGSGDGYVSEWEYCLNLDGYIEMSGSTIQINSGTTSGALACATRAGDYLPLIFGADLYITQRISDQTSHVGFMDSMDTPKNQAVIVFDGTDPTIIKFRTSVETADVEESTISLPGGAVTSDYHNYQIEICVNHAVLLIDNVQVAKHHRHVPGPYDIMDYHIGIQNTDTTPSNTTLITDDLWVSNFNKLEVSITATGDPLSISESASSSPFSTTIPAVVASTLLLAYNNNRLGATIYNDSVGYLYVKLGNTVSPTSFTVRLSSNDYYEVPFKYIGEIYGYWTVAVGDAKITEVS